MKMAFQALLVHLSFINAQATAIMDEGIGSPEDLRTYTQADVKALFKHLASRGMHPPYQAQQKFQIFRYWVEKCIPLALPLNSVVFTDEEIKKWGERMKAASDEKDAGQKSTIQPPEAFKKDTKWRSWKEQFQNYLGTKLGQSKIPLTYIIRPDDEPGDEADFDDDYDLMVFLTPHTGEGFKKDNGTVYDELKALLLKSYA